MFVSVNQILFHLILQELMKLLANNGISVYPNPTTGIVKIILNNNFNSDYIVDIYDNVGGLLQTLKKSKSEVNFDLDLSSYSAGIYLITGLYFR